MLYERMSGKYKDKRSSRLPEIPAYLTSSHKSQFTTGKKASAFSNS